MNQLNELTADIVAFRDAREWKQFHNPKDLALSLVLESAEFMEHFQWKTPAEVDEHVSSNREALADELADVLYWILLISHDLEIDIERAMKNKLAKNIAKYPESKSKGRHTKYTGL